MRKQKKKNTENKATPITENKEMNDRYSWRKNVVGRFFEKNR